MQIIYIFIKCHLKLELHCLDYAFQSIAYISRLEGEITSKREIEYAMCVILITLRMNNILLRIGQHNYDNLRNLYLTPLSNLHKDVRLFNRLMNADKRTTKN